MTYIRTPFANVGDKTAIPNDAQVDNSVSFAEGYTLQYSLDPATEATARRIERDKYNQLLNIVTAEIQQYQQFSIPLFITSADNGGVAFPYSIGAQVRFDPGAGTRVYQSLTNTNVTDPTDTGNWFDVTDVITQTNSVQVINKTLLQVDNLRLDGNTISSLNTNGNIILDPDGTGRIGINVSSPVPYIIDAAGVNGVAAGINFTDHLSNRCIFGNVSSSGSSDWEIFNFASGYVRIATNSIERFRVTAAGDIGVNEINPQSLWHVNGNTIINGTLDLGNNSDTTISRVSAGIVAIEGNNILTTQSAPTDLNGVTATATEINELDESANAVTNYVSGVRTYINQNLSQGTVFDVDANLTVGVFESIGPTGSGATNTWAALDDLPSDARVAIVRCLIIFAPDTIDSNIVAAVQARMNGASLSGDIATLDHIIDDNISQSASTMSMAPVPLDSSQIFEAAWSSSGSSGALAITLTLVGFIA